MYYELLHVYIVYIIIPACKITIFTFHKYNSILFSDPISWKTMYVESIEKQPNLKLLSESVIVSNMILYYTYML
jgi:hypothetical protein